MLDSEQKNFVAGIFSYFVCNFWQNPAFFSQETLPKQRVWLLIIHMEDARKNDLQQSLVLGI